MINLISITSFLICGVTSLFTSAQQTQKPNIVFILADDMGYECVGTYGGTYNTPNIDKMAKNGVTFTHAYSQPLCTPSRVQVMTGKYNFKNYSEFGFLNQDQKTFGHLAKEAGYVTGIVGKWQLGANPNLPKHFGFDSYCLWQLNYKRSPEGERYANPLIESDGKIIDRNADRYGPDVFNEYIENFIEINKERPFLLYYPMALPHSPFVSTPVSEDWDKNLAGRTKNDTKYFSDMIEYVDKNVGRIIEKLKSEGLYENTLLIFTGDNGTHRNIFSKMQDGSIIKGGKGLTTDAGTLVPMVARYGNHVKSATCTDLIDFTDIMATMAEAMSTAVPEEWDTDGVSFLPQILGKSGQKREWVFCHYDNFFNGADKPNEDAKRYIRNHQYKLYSTGEFFDVKNDVLEQNNISYGEGNIYAENARKFLGKELVKFPKWQTGDIPVKKIILPGLEVKYIFWEDSKRNRQ